jgi:hypothetical protein
MLSLRNRGEQLNLLFRQRSPIRIELMLVHLRCVPSGRTPLTLGQRFPVRSAAGTWIGELDRIILPPADRANQIGAIGVSIYGPKSAPWTREAHRFAERSASLTPLQ